MLSSTKILDLVSNPPAPGLKGKVDSARRSLRTSMNGLAGPVSHHRFLADMAAQADGASQQRPETYQHPMDDPRARSARAIEGLTPSDIAWVTRLPLDPEQISHEDAVQLAALASGLQASVRVPGAQGGRPVAATVDRSSDARLLNSVWVPVKEVHDAKAAQVALNNAGSPVPEVPSSTLSALADALAAEVPQLQPDEALARADNQLRNVLDKRNGTRDRGLLDAQASIARAADAASVRTARTR